MSFNPSIPPSTYKCHKCGIGGHYINGCKGSLQKKAKTSCWFCLGESSIRMDLIIKAYKEYYVAFSKESLSPGHLLIIPIKHDFDDFDERDEFRQLMKVIIDYYYSNGMVSIFFYIKRKNDHHHRHIQCLPISLKDKDLFIESVLEKRKSLHSSIKDLESHFSIYIDTDIISKISFEGYFPSDFGKNCLAPFLIDNTSTITDESLQSFFKNKQI